MKMRITTEVKEKVLTYTLSGILIVGAYLLVQKMAMIQVALTNLLGIIMPFILGFALAFLMSGCCRWIEEKCLKKLPITYANKRRIAVVISLLLFILCFIGFVVLLGSQVVLSIQDFINNFSSSLLASSEYFESIYHQLEFLNDYTDKITAYISENFESALNILRTQIPAVFNYSVILVTYCINAFIALVVAAYIMLDREKLYRNIKQINYALLPQNNAIWLERLSSISSQMFKKFVIGKAIDSAIIGILCYIGMSLLEIDFALLISFIVGVTNMIPFFGPFIGAIPGMFILLISDPQASIVFALWILALQQFDGNILGPKILGDSLGLPKVWVLFAIVVGGAVFGIVGMFLGVPVFAVVYLLVKEYVQKRLVEKEIEIK